MKLATPQIESGTRPASAPGAGGEESKSVRFRSLDTLKPYVLCHKGMLAGALAALLISALATLAVPLAVRRVIDLGFSGIETELINKYFAALIGIGLILALASAARFYAVNWLGERIVADIRRDVFAHLTGLSPAFYEVSHSGEMMSRITADTTQVKATASTAASQSLRNILLLVGGVAMMIVTSPKLSLAVVIAIPAIVLPLMAYGRAVRARSREAQDLPQDRPNRERKLAGRHQREWIRGDVAAPKERNRECHGRLAPLWLRRGLADPGIRDGGTAPNAWLLPLRRARCGWNGWNRWLG